MREDWKVIRAMHGSDRYSAALRAAWMAAPLLRVDITARAEACRKSTVVPRPGSPELPLPFDSAVMRLHMTDHLDDPSAEHEVQVWALYERPTDVRPGQVGGITDVFVKITVVVFGEGVTKHEDKILKPSVSVMGADASGKLWTYTNRFDAERIEPISNAASDANLQLALACEAIYAHGGHMVRSAGAPPRSAKERKTHERLPWLRDNLPDVSLMLGPPPEVFTPRHSAPSVDVGGVRHAPRPHNRRGHFRHYKSGARVFIRPAWVGPSDWKIGGRTYNLVTSARPAESELRPEGP